MSFCLLRMRRLCNGISQILRERKIIIIFLLSFWKKNHSNSNSIVSVFLGFSLLDFFSSSWCCLAELNNKLIFFRHFYLHKYSLYVFIVCIISFGLPSDVSLVRISPICVGGFFLYPFLYSINVNRMNNVNINFIILRFRLLYKDNEEKNYSLNVNVNQLCNPNIVFVYLKEFFAIIGA